MWPSAAVNVSILEIFLPYDLELPWVNLRGQDLRGRCARLAVLSGKKVLRAKALMRINDLFTCFTSTSRPCRILEKKVTKHYDEKHVTSEKREGLYLVKTLIKPACIKERIPYGLKPQALSLSVAKEVTWAVV